MATIELRHDDDPATGPAARVGPRVPRRQLALLASLLLIAASAAAVAGWLSHRSTARGDVVARALGPRGPSFLTDRHWDRLTRVTVGNAVRIRRAGTSVALTAQGTRNARWTRHAWGLDRSTPYGRQSIVVAAPRTEEYLTVGRRLGTRTWTWLLEARNTRPRLEVDGSVTLSASGIRILPVLVFDRSGEDVTPAGARWSLRTRAGRTYLALRLDDATLPTPYVIDPIAIVGSPGQTGSTKTGSPLTITKPTGVATGNLLVATISLRDATATITPPAGWTPLTSVASSGATTNQLVYSKVATASEPASYAWSWASGSGATDSSGVVLAYSGIWAGTGSNIDTSTTATANATTSATTAAGAAAYAQDMVLALYGTAGDSSFTTPTGMTVRGSVSSQSGAPAVRSSSGSFDVIQAAAGAIGAKTSTITSRDATAVMVAIRPAAAAASASLSTVTASPTSVLADGSTTATITASIKDANGNPLSGKTVTLAKSGGSSTITTVSGSTDAAGAATFTVNDAAVESATYTATDTTDSVAVTQTASVTFTAGPVTAAQSTASASPTSVTANGVATSTLTVTLKDAQSHAVSGKTVTLAKSGGSSTITTVTGTTNASGQATFTVKDTVAEATTYTATDTTDSVVVAQTPTVTFTAGAVTAAQSSVSASPTSIVADGATTSTVTVTLKDANSNPVSGKTVTLAKSGGSSTITTLSGTTNASGQATFTVKDSAVESTTFTATDTTDTIAVTQTASVAFTAGPVSAGASTVTSSPGSVTANGTSSSTITVTAKDAFSHLLSGQTVTLAQGGGSSTIAPASATTNASGVATFTATATVTQTVAYTATVAATAITQTAQVIFTPGAATQLTVTAPASATAGASFGTLTVTARDANNNVATGYTGTVTFSGGGSSPTFPSNYTFVAGDNGTHTFTATLRQAGARAITATDTVTGTITGTSGTITVNPAGASTLTVTGPAAATAGVSFNTLAVTAKDAFGNTATGYTGTVTFSGGGSSPTLPSNYAFIAGDNGTHTFTATLRQAGARTITATDTVTGTITGTTGTITVSAAAASTLTVSGPAAATAGVAFNTITVTAKDAFGNTATGYTGTVAFSGGGSSASLSSNYTFVAGDNGTHTFGATLTQAGARTITATDTVTSAITGSSGAITVNAAGAATLVVSAPANGTAGTAFGAAVTAKDAFANTATGYTGTVHFTSTDPQAVLPGDYTFAAGDAGAHTFANGVTFGTAGSQTVTATDSGSTAVTGTSGGVTVTPAALASFAFSLTGPQVNGTAFSGTNTLTARDAYGNTVTSFNAFGDNVTITAGAPLTGTVSGLHGANVLNLASDFVNGVADLSSFGLTYTGNATSGALVAAAQTGETGSSSAVTIMPGAAASLAVTGAATQTAGQAQTVTVTARDASGNVATSYTGAHTITFLGAAAIGGFTPTVTSTSGTAVAFGTAETVTFTNGVSTAGGSMLLYRSGSPTIAASAGDGGTGGNMAITAAGAARLGVAVSAAPISAFDLTATTTTPTAGASAGLTITARDAFGNVATSYTGDHALTFGGAASSPAPATPPTISDRTGIARAFGTPTTLTFTNGVASVSGSSNGALTLYKTESAHLTVDDGPHNNGTGTSFTVAAAPPSKLAVTAVNGGATATAGVGFVADVEAEDAYGNASGTAAPTGFALSLAAGTGSLGGTTTGAIAAGQAHASVGGVTYTNAESGVRIGVTRTSGDNLSAGSSPAFTVAASADRLAVASINGGADPIAGTAFAVVVQARDAQGNTGNVGTATGFTLALDTGSGTLGGTLTGAIPAGQGQATLNVTYTKAEAGVKLAATRTSGDALLGAVTAPFTVDPGAAAKFVLIGSGTQTAGDPNQLTITADDANGNVAMGYGGDHGVTFSGAQPVGANEPTVTDKDGNAVAFGSSATLTFTNGVAASGGSLVLVKAGSANIVATAGSVSTTGADRLGVTVSPAATSTLAVSAGAGGTQTAGTPFDLTVTARDRFGNTTPGYTGRVDVSSTDPAAVLPSSYAFGGGDNGTHTFASGVTLKTAGARTIGAADHGTPSIFGTAGPIAVAAAATDHLAVTTSAVTPQTAGAAFDVTLTAQDAFGNTTPGYTGTASFTSSDSAAALPSPHHFTAGDSGTKTFTAGATLKTAGTQTVAAADQTTSSIAGSAPITVGAATATHFTVATSAAAPQTAGVPFAVTVTARDAFGNVAGDYTGTVHFDATDAQAVLPADYAFTGSDAGSHIFSGSTLATVGAHTLTAADSGDASVTGTSSTVTVGAAAAARLVLTGSATQAAGTSQNVSLRALDAFGNTATAYTGAHDITFSGASSSTAPLTAPTVGGTVFGAPASLVFANGVSTPNALVLYRAETAQIAATDGTIAATGAGRLTVAASPATAARIGLTTTAASPQTAGVGIDVTATAFDAFGNVATGYTGGIELASTDAQASLPVDYTFATGDAGTHTLPGVVLRTAGPQTITATDTVVGSIAGTTPTIVVAPAATVTFAVTNDAAAPQVAGQPFSVTVTARDAFGNTTPAYAGTVHLASTDAQASLAADHTFGGADAGTYVFSAALKTAGAQTVSADDGSSTGSTNVTVGAAAADHFGVTTTAGTLQTAGAAFATTATARDAFGNIATGYRGTVRFASGDAHASLPGDYTFTAADNGTHAFSGVVLKSAGSRSVAVGDGAVTGSATVAVAPAATTRLELTADAGSPQAAGTPFAITVTAQDAFGNTTPGYTGTVRFTSTDARAVLPGDYAFDAGDGGSRSFSVVLRTAGSRSLAAADAGDGSIAGATGVDVAAAAADHLTVTTDAATPQTAGTAVSATVTARDAYGNIDTAYSGTVTFASDDAQATVPSDYTFTGSDSGSHTFAIALTYRTVGTRSVRATDTSDATITGATPGATVASAGISSFRVTAATTAPTAGAAAALTVTGLDPFGNVATGYTGDHALVLTGLHASTDPVTQPTVSDKNGNAQPLGNPTTLTFANGVSTTGGSLLAYKAESASLTIDDGAHSNGPGLMLHVGAAAASRLAVVVDNGTTPTAGIAFPVVGTALDDFGNAATVTAPTEIALARDAGTGTLGGTVTGTIALGTSQLVLGGVTYSKAESGVQLTLARSSGDNLASADSGPFTVSSVADRLIVATVNGGTTPTADTPFAVTIRAEDANHNPSTPTVDTAFSLTLAAGAGPLGGTLTGTLPAGQTQVTVSGLTYTSAESGVQLRVTRTSGDALLAGMSTPFTVAPGAAARFVVDGSRTQTAGEPNQLTITAYDAHGNLATGFTGNHALTFSGANSAGTNTPTVTDGTGTTVALGTPTTLAFANGISAAGGSLTLYRAEGALVAATAGAVTTPAGDRLAVAVSPAATASLDVATTAATPQTAGGAFDATVVARDAYGNTTPGYRGTVTFASGDAQAVLPGSFTFGAGDDGAHTFAAGIALRTAGPATVTVTDDATPTISGGAAATVAPAAAARLRLTGAATQTAGTAHVLTVTALDQFGNTATGYTGDHAVTFGGAADSPAPATHPTVDAVAFGSPTTLTFAAGVATGTLKLYGAGTPAIAGSAGGLTTSGADRLDVTVTHAALAKLALALSSPQVNGTAFSGANTVTAEDAYGNIVAAFDASATRVTLAPTGALTGSLSGRAVLDRSTDFVAGIADLTSLGVTYTGAAGSGTLQATTPSGEAGTAPLTVVGGAATTLTVSGAGTQVAGVPQQLTITAKDVSGNTSPFYTGDHTLTFAGASAAASTAPTISDKPGSAVAFGTPTTISFASGVSSAGGSLTLYKAESAQVGAADGSIAAAGVDRLAVAVSAAAPSATMSTIAASPPSRVADGASAATVTVRATDVYGNAVTTGGASVALHTDRGTLAGTADNGDGTYTAALTSASAGVAHVTGTIDGAALSAGATVTFVADAVSAGRTTVAASSGTAGTDGGGATITVTVKDANDNTIPNAHVTLTQGGATSAAIAPAPLAGADSDGNGVATFSVSDTVAEGVVFSATVSGALVTQTAAVVFLPGTADAAHSVLSATPLAQTAGASSTLTVRAKDAHGNDLTSGAATVVLSTTLGVVGAVTDHGNGTYTATLSATAAGTAHVTGTLDGATVGGSPVPVDFAPGAADAAHTAISAAPATINADGSSGTAAITVRVEDAYGNDLTAGGAAVTLATTKGSLGSVTDNGDGSYSATLTATGQSGLAHVTGQLDGAAIGGSANVTLTPPVPVVTIDGGVPSGQTASVSVDATFHSPNDDGATHFECSLDSGTLTACTAPMSYSGLPDGAHTFGVRGVNGNGPGTPATATWTVDTTGPNVQLTTAPAAYTNNPVEALAATAADATTSVAGVDFLFATTAAGCPTGSLITTDTTPDGTGAFTAAWTTPGDGSYVVCAVAHDPLGNASPAPSTSPVVVDRTKPVATLPAFGTVVGPITFVRGSRAIHATALDATSGVSAVDFTFAGATSGPIDHLAGAGTPGTTDAADATWDTTSLADGPYSVAMIARDKAANAVTQTRDVVVDNTAPTVSVDDPGAYGNGTIPLTVTAGDTGSGVDATSIVVESSAHGAGAWTPIADPSSWTPADGSYDVRATARDRVGNQATSSVRTIVVDNTAPTVTDDTDTAWHNGDVTVTLAANDLQSGVASVESQVDGGSWTPGTTVTISKTSGDGTHTVTYRATSRAGVTSTPRAATVKIDASAPSAAAPGVTPAATYARGTIDIAATATDAVSGIAPGYPAYRIAPAGTPETTPSGNCPNWGTAAASHFDTRTIADGQYLVRTIAVDNAANGLCSNVATATALAIDNTAPATVVRNVPLATQNQDVTVALDATDNLSGVRSTRYRVDNGPWTAGTTVVVAAPADHSNDGVHTIDYFSTDTAGNAESAQSAEVAIDTTGPAGSAADPSNILRGTVPLTASPTERDIATVQWLYRTVGSTGAYTPVGPADDAAPWQTNWLTNGVFDGDYDLEVIFTDTTGNTTTQPLSTKTIDNNAPDTASVTAPAQHAVVSESVTLAYSAHDATAGIDAARARFEVKAAGDSAFVPVAGTTWNSAAKPDGPAEVHVAVWDRAGNGPIYSSPVTFDVDNTNPAVALSAPSVVGTSATLAATGSADITSVDFDVSPHGAGAWTHLATTRGPHTTTWTPGGATADGLYDIRATATDLGGHHGEDVKTVRVDQTAPTGTLTDPAAGDTVGGPSVLLRATADGTGSSVTSVRFQYRALPGGTFADVSTAAAAPYSATWNTTGLASASYELRAVATDAAGNTLTTGTTTISVDSTPPEATFTPRSPLGGNARLALATVDADATSVTYALSPAGAGSWTEVARSTVAPTFAGMFATGAFADGVFDVRATVADRFGNTTQKVVADVRIDNTAPSLVSSTPADGSVVATVGSVSAVASEPVASVAGLRLDDESAAVSATLSGAALTFSTGALAPGVHALTGRLVDAAGNSRPFRINLTVRDASSAALPATSKNVSTLVATTLTSVDDNASVVVPANVWQRPVPTPQDFLVLRVQPLPAVAVTSESMQATNVVDVRLTWNLARTDEHHFDAPLEIDLSDPSGRGLPATSDGGNWRMLQPLDTPGTLPTDVLDGYWRENGLVHVLTRHLSTFAILSSATPVQSAPPRDFAGVVAADGLTLRWAPGIDDEQVSGFSLYVNGTAARSFGPREFEAKLGPVSAQADSRFTITETNTSGAESAAAAALRVVPPVAGLGRAEAEAALRERSFTVGRVTTVAAPNVPTGTVVGPTSLAVLAEGSAVDLQVAGTAAAPSPLAFSVANAPRIGTTTRTVFARVLLTRPGRVDVTLDAKPYHRIQRWHFLHLHAGVTMLRLDLSQTLPLGGYDLYWLATAAGDGSVQRRITPLQSLGVRTRARRAAPPANQHS